MKLSPEWDHELVALLALWLQGTSATAQQTSRFVKVRGFWRGEDPYIEVTLNSLAGEGRLMQQADTYTFTLSAEGYLYGLARSPEGGKLTTAARIESRSLVNPMNRIPPEVAASRTGSKHHNVYVVLLSEDVRYRYPQGINSNRLLTLPYVYVGVTGLTPEERFRNHKRCHKGSWYVREYGIRLLPELYEAHNPMSYDKAAIVEGDLAWSLREKGFGVLAGHHDRQT